MIDDLIDNVVQFINSKDEDDLGYITDTRLLCKNNTQQAHTINIQRYTTQTSQSLILSLITLIIKEMFFHYTNIRIKIMSSLIYNYYSPLQFLTTCHIQILYVNVFLVLNNSLNDDGDDAN